MKRSLVISLGITVALTIIVFAATLGGGWAPKLGLDLAGGSEVVYKPAHTISSAEMDTTVNVIRNRVDGAGVSGATVDSQGGNVVVQFPGDEGPGSAHQAHRDHGPALLQDRPVRGAGLRPARQGEDTTGRAPAVVRPVRDDSGEPEREHEHPEHRRTTSRPIRPSPPTPRPRTTTPPRSCCCRPIPLRGRSSTPASSWARRTLKGSAIASARRRCSTPPPASGW